MRHNTSIVRCPKSRILRVWHYGSGTKIPRHYTTVRQRKDRMCIKPSWMANGKQFMGMQGPKFRSLIRCHFALHRREKQCKTLPSSGICAHFQPTWTHFLHNSDSEVDIADTGNWELNEKNFCLKAYIKLGCSGTHSSIILTDLPRRCSGLNDGRADVHFPRLNIGTKQKNMTLILLRSCVAPIKLSLQRLEFKRTVLGARMKEYSARSLSLPVLRWYVWTSLPHCTTPSARVSSTVEALCGDLSSRDLTANRFGHVKSLPWSRESGQFSDQRSMP